MTGIFARIKNYLSFVKFSHTVFAMPFAITGFSLGMAADKSGFSFRLLLLVILCMIFARNAAMGFNRLADKRFDALNPRTSSREIPKGVISPKAATAFVIVNSILFIVTTGFINKLTLLLSPVALLVILGYSLTKRYTSLCHFILGLGLSLAPIGAYISVTGRFAFLPVVYSFIVLTWVSGFDIIYALQDDDFDRNNNLKSMPSTLGREKALVLSAFLHLFTILFVVIAGFMGHGALLFWSGAVIFSSLLIYQHLIVSYKDISRVTIAFQTTNGIASIIFAMFAIADILIRQS
jgi:4-hydroxybenzoate polyprenyltransferase